MLFKLLVTIGTREQASFVGDYAVGEFADLALGTRGEVTLTFQEIEFETFLVYH